VKSTVQQVPFGATQEGQAVDLYTLRNAHGVTARVLTYGAAIYSIETPDKHGRFVNITANRASVADYETGNASFGSLLGRYANRIAHGRFTLDRRQFSLTRNDGSHHIHGGARGFDRHVWRAETLQGTDFAALMLTYVSKDGEEGYPGTLRCTIRYEMNDDNEWTMKYTAETDKATPVNLSNHAYWNLAGAQSGQVLDHLLSVNADRYLTVDGTLIPTGEMMPVAGTALDFRTLRAIGERIAQIKEPQFVGGYDHCLVLNQKSPGDLTFCARLKDSKSGRTMEVFTTEPAVQVYSANFPGGGLTGPGDFFYPRHAGLCLETQHFPDSPNQPRFPSTILRPAAVYRSTTIHKFGVEKQARTPFCETKTI